jgi:hypothetical protein
MGGPHNADHTIYFEQTTQFIMGGPHNLFWGDLTAYHGHDNFFWDKLCDVVCP